MQDTKFMHVAFSVSLCTHGLSATIIRSNLASVNESGQLPVVCDGNELLLEIATIGFR